jgi:DNA-binding MarR family transcriptional regulator
MSENSSELDAEELELWRGLLIWFGTITTEVEHDLTVATGLSAADFQILARLDEAPDGTVEQQALRDGLRWSPSRLSHQLARMEKRGYITRAEIGPGTRMQIAITGAGGQVVRSSVPVHARAVRRHLFDELTPEHRGALGLALTKAGIRSGKSD